MIKDHMGFRISKVSKNEIERIKKKFIWVFIFEKLKNTYW